MPDSTPRWTVRFSRWTSLWMAVRWCWWYPRYGFRRAYDGYRCKRPIGDAQRLTRMELHELKQRIGVSS